MKKSRISKNRYYLNIADAVSGRSTCIRRAYGAVIVKDDEIISTGYNGSPRGFVNCCDTGLCKREELNIPKGERYELCEAVHAEQNAIISASREKLKGATIYVVGRNIADETLACGEPCSICSKLIHNSGIAKIVYLDEKGRETSKNIGKTSMRERNC